jgi:DyP dimeric alpha+beta barrel domain
MMKTKRKKKRKTLPKEAAMKGRNALQPLEIPIHSPTSTAKFSGVLAELGKFEPKLPKGILIPALTGDPDSEIPDAEPEPVYNLRARSNIQGNTIPGFNKDHQHFVFFRLGNIRRAKAWLRWIAPLISSMEEVLAWVRAFRAMRQKLGGEPPTCATWVTSRFRGARLNCL